MIKKLSVILFFACFIGLIGCEQETTVLEIKGKEVIKTPVEEVKAIMPLKDRRYVYHNAIQVEEKNIQSTGQDKVPKTDHYPTISGLKNIEVQDKINQRLKETAQNLLPQLEEELKNNGKNDIRLYEHKYTDAYITYSLNNVIFVNYSARVQMPYNIYNEYPTYKWISEGYDLNTGEELKLSDLFRPDMDYKKKINNYICQYLIENNYDDYSRERMTKPFQGIREDQSFTFDLEALRIILDEKNDEFVSREYSDIISIPLEVLGDDLYIFDKYSEEGKSIYQKEKLVKKLLPNQIEFKADNMIEEGNHKYYIGITEGKFINVPDKNIEKKLNEMVACKYDVQGFIKKAEKIEGETTNSNFGHYINIFTNAGGLLSIAVSDEVFLGSHHELYKTSFNYDFNSNREIRLKDIFIDETKASNVILKHIKKLDLPISEEAIQNGLKETLESSDFNFDEAGIALNLLSMGEKLSSNQNWAWISFEEFGIENIRFLN